MEKQVKTHIVMLLLFLLLPCAKAMGEGAVVFVDAWEKWPYSFVNGKGEPDGFDIELVREVMRRLGKPVTIRLKDQDSVYVDIREGRADLTFAVKTGQYAQYGRFAGVTITHAETSLMVPRSDSLPHITIGELCQRKLLVRDGSMSHQALLDYGMPDSLISAERHMAMAILDMVGRGGGAAVWNTVMLKWLMRKYDIRDHVLVPTDIPSAEYRFMGRDVHLLHAIDSVCLKMQHEGRIDRMKNRWVYPDKEGEGFPYLYLLLTAVAVGVVLTAIVLLMRHYRIYYSHDTLDDVNAQMELILSANGLRVWVYDMMADTYAWMTPDGRVEQEHSAFEFSSFYPEGDFALIHAEMTGLKQNPGKTVTKSLHGRTVSMQAIADDYGKVYMVCGVEKEGKSLKTPLRGNLEEVAQEIMKRVQALRTIVVAVLLTSLFVSLPSFADPLPSSSLTAKSTPLGIRYTKKHPLVIACDWNFAPYSFRNDRMKADGFLVDVVREIFSQTHIPYEIRMVDWKQAKRMLYSGEAQLMMDVRKPDDLHGVKYGRSVLAPYPVSVARMKGTSPMSSVELLTPSDTVHVNYGDYALHYIVTRNPKPIVLPCAPYEALSDLLSGKIRYYVCGQEVLRREVMRFSLQDRIELDDVGILDGQFSFMSNDAQLLAETDAQFERLQALGRYKPLVDKWLSEDPQYGRGQEEGILPDVIAIVGMLLLFVGSIIALVFIMRGGNTGNLKREFKAIAHMSIELTGCNVLAINVRRMWVYNVSGDYLPRKGLPMSAYEALIHPDDIMTEYEARRRVDEGERNMPVVSFRMRKHDGAPDDWHQMSVHAYVKSKKAKPPAYVYLALTEEEGSRSEEAQKREKPHPLAELRKLAAELINTIDRMNVLYVVFGLLFVVTSAFGRIDRKALVTRNNPVVNTVDTMGSLSVGNGRFAFTTDITGLQTFPEYYRNGVPLGTQSQWGWHSFANPDSLRIEESYKEYDFGHGHPELYATEHKEQGRARDAANWYRMNPHRLHLGCIGVELEGMKPSDISKPYQTLDMWKGEIYSQFAAHNSQFLVSTVCHPERDMIAGKVERRAKGKTSVAINLRFPYPTGAHSDDACNWNAENCHKTELVRNGKNAAVLRRIVDEIVYYVVLTWEEEALLREKSPNYWVLEAKGRQLTYTCEFLEGKEASVAVPPSSKYFYVRLASSTHWQKFWQEGAAVDFSECKDKRAGELERRVVLSQWLLAIQCAGDTPPQETGLTYNSWFGKFHMEMIWWHQAWLPLWGHPEKLARTMQWYAKAEPKAREIAQRQGFRGVRWMKMTDPSGEESPSKVGSFLIWQQPHVIYLAELLRRANLNPNPVLDGLPVEELIESTAEFMADFATYDSVADRYVLKGVIPAQETLKASETYNPPLELSYWHYALNVAQQWRERGGKERSSLWDDVIQKLSPLAERDGLYLAAESAPSPSTPPSISDHPAVLGAVGMLPMSCLVDKEVMRNTLEWIWSNWNWDKTWGWDYPLVAMNAARLGEPEKAVEALLMDKRTNTYLPNGHNCQDKRLRCYLPGNGGLLTAIAMMCAGWDGCEEPTPGFPKNGQWNVRWEGLQPLP